MEKEKMDETLDDFILKLDYNEKGQIIHVEQTPIVRCKHCIHSPAANDDCPLPAHYIVPDGYCHLGEKDD